MGVGRPIHPHFDLADDAVQDVVHGVGEHLHPVAQFVEAVQFDQLVRGWRLHRECLGSFVHCNLVVNVFVDLVCICGVLHL